MSFCVVNFSNGAWYPKGQHRLEVSISKFGHSFIKFDNYSVINCPTHQENPYAFKIYSILKAYNMGYQKVLWMDSSAWAIRSLSEIDKIIEQDGIFLEYGGERVGTWTNDFTINYFNTNRTELMDIPVVVAGISGFNFGNQKSIDIFSEWKKACDSGCFKGAWNNNNLSESSDERCKGHRHDLSSLSILASKYQAKIQQPHSFLQYVYPNVPIKESSTILLQGM